MDKCLDTIIGGIIGLIGVILGFFLDRFFIYLSEKKHIKEEFFEIKNSIYSITLVNNLFPELLRLKSFLVRNSNFLKRQENNDFFQKWLKLSYVEEAFKGSGYWNKERINEMFQDLDKMKT